MNVTPGTNLGQTLIDILVKWCDKSDYVGKKEKNRKVTSLRIYLELFI